MLAAMRKSATTTFAKIFLFGLLIISFAAWGIADFVAPTPQSTTAAFVGDREISVVELDRAYRNELNRLNLQAIEPEQAQALGLGTRVLENLISETLITLEAGNLGLTAADATVVAAIQSNPLFRDNLGQFQRARYEQFLAATGQPEAYYVAQIRQQIARQQLLESVIVGASLPPAVAQTLYSYRNETRQAAFLTVPLDRDNAVNDPGDAELAGYFEENGEAFRQPEYRAAAYISLTAEGVMDSVPVSEEELQAAYEERKGEFTNPERREVLQMLLPDEASAKSAYDRVSAGEDFATVAEELTGSAIDSISLGKVTASEIIDPTVSSAAFAATLNNPTPPAQGIFGWFITMVTDIETGSISEFAEVSDRLRNDIALTQAIEIVYTLSTDLDDQLGGGATLEEAATVLDLEVVTVPAVDAAGLDPSGEPVDLPDRARFVRVLFDTPDKSDSLLEDTSDNGYFVLRNDGTTESRVPPLEDVRDTVIEAWKADQRYRNAEAVAERVVEALNSGGSVQDIATQEGYTIAETGAFTRDEGADGLPDAVRRSLFDGDVGTVASGRTIDGYVVAKLASVEKVNPLEASTSDAIDALREQLAIGLSNDLLAQFRDALEANYDITIDETAVNQIY